MKINRAQQLVDTAARRRLTPGERAEWEAWLTDHPAGREAWEVELRLSRVLGSLIASPVPSNFTNRVLAAVERETARRERSSSPRRPAWARAFWRWQWALGSAAMLLVGAWFMHQQQQWHSRQQVVESVQALTEVAGLPSLEMLQDFDAIYNLPAGPVPSVEELESALQYLPPMALSRRFLRLPALALAGWLGLGGAVPASSPSPAAARESSPPRLPPMPSELPPRPPSPVAVFRQLLQADAAERAVHLAGRSAAQRAYLEAQLREFDALSATEQEARLRLSELQWYLRPLLNTPPGQRADLFKTVPPAYRAGVRDRLAAWDALPPAEREALREDRAVAARLCRQPAEVVADAITNQAGLSPEQQAQTARALTRWRRMSAAQQRERVEQLGRFFQFSEAQKQRTLGEVVRVSQPQAAGLMSRLDQLSPTERARCLAALQRFATLPPTERERFLRNATRWSALSPEERHRWRQLQAKLPPMPVELPPRPPLVRAENGRAPTR